jgi:haloalkane dehalogenase
MNAVMQRDSSRDTSPAETFRAAATRYQDVGTAEIAYRTFGSGEPILFLHGWPLSGFTWRKVVPQLAAHFTCVVVDLPGAGATRWRPENDFSFSGQARNLLRFVEKLGLERSHIIGHDTGATIGRALALLALERVRTMTLIGTEIPNHRPPWIPLFQRTVALPGSAAVFRLLLRSRAFTRSPLGFGNVFADKRRLDGEFSDEFIAPLLTSRHALEGQLHYLGGIDWALVDRLATDHRRIGAPVLLIWGEQDTIFPVERARAMASQFADCRGFHVVPDAKLLVHEEQPAIVARHILEFLRGID